LKRPGPWKIDPREKTSRLFSRPRLQNLAAGFLLILALYGWGVMRVRHAADAVDHTLRVAVLQGNIDQYQKWDDRYEAGVRSSYESLLAEAILAKPDLVVWPESAVPGWIPNDRQYVEWLNRLAVRARAPQIVGAISSVKGRDLNSAFLVNPRGELIDAYSKEKLVPFGEYVPFGGFLKRWIPYLGQVGVFYPGLGNHLFDVNGARVAVNICYEAIFADLVRRDAAPGADLIVNITNDGWFLKTAGPEQHFLVNVFRAVENGRSVVRAANTGVSAVIDPFDQVLARTPLLEPELLIEEVPISRPDFRPLYARAGGWFLGFCWLLIAASLYFLRARGGPPPAGVEGSV
jgi:apolipoprotein N-acyltransferase